MFVKQIELNYKNKQFYRDIKSRIGILNRFRFVGDEINVF